MKERLWKTGMRRCFAGLLVLVMVLSSLVTAVASDVTMTQEDIETVIEEVARRKNIPPVILKAIAWKESRKTQFTSAGAPFVSRGNRGIMQINQIHTGFDAEMILYDVEYNIEAGADILLSKWLDPRTPVVGDRDPNVLEHWYFALWAYNGWLSRNNPNLHGENTYQDGLYNLIHTRYGQEVSMVDWSYIPASGLPPADLHLPEPAVTHEGGILFFQPEDRALADARQELYVLDGPGGDVRFTVTRGTELVIAGEAQLADGLYWYRVNHPASGQIGWVAAIYLKPAFVHEEAADDALWSLLLEPAIPEPLHDENDPHGEAEADHAEHVEGEDGEAALDIQAVEAVDPVQSSENVPSENVPPENGTSEEQDDPDTIEAALMSLTESGEIAADQPADLKEERQEKAEVSDSGFHFIDMKDHPAREAVETLAALGVVSTSSAEFRPHQTISRQEIALMLHRFFRLGDAGLSQEALYQQLSAYQDGATVDAWAQDAMARAAALRIVTGYPDGTIRPHEAATREQGVVMVVKAMEDQVLPDQRCASDYFEDGKSIHAWALPSVNTLLKSGIFEGLDHTAFHPQQEMTRVELAVVLYRLHQATLEE
ncbi:S-layer homology domain-containing protein [Anoxynatronum buryatiense]|uniref:S-layer homology domain-containing protein n=1 Tax=Anoxynatronum buryatiense TaxID=489973 RepID=A0AA46AIQ2_9CLOT|nr:S-layer homology domain-containing protein [Anoxynatronum buryatiense]SMP52444.1 S-layer homology domain-containing protein [Anoxynatronum buryatiense]